jgi:hypothetical protein
MGSPDGVVAALVSMVSNSERAASSSAVVMASGKQARPRRRQSQRSRHLEVPAPRSLTLAATLADYVADIDIADPTDCTQTITNVCASAAQPAGVVQQTPAFSG